jgi:FlaA1/EpsC-like NDP-sugar epimerase
MSGPKESPVPASEPATTESLYGAPAWSRPAIALIVDCFVAPVMLWIALVLRYGTSAPDAVSYWPAFVVAALSWLPLYAATGLYRQVIRYSGGTTMFEILKAATVSAIVIAAVAHTIPLVGFPRSVPAIYWLLMVVYFAGSRFGFRALLQVDRQAAQREPVIVFGANPAGIQLAATLRLQKQTRPVAFIDEDARLQNRIVSGLKVHAPHDLERLIETTGASRVLVAASATAPAERRRIMRYLEPHASRLSFVPGVVGTDASLAPGALRYDVPLPDLLERDEVATLPHLMQGTVRDRRVIVTGAGGSIGAELCRQIIRQRPRVLVLLDLSEFALFEIHRELRQIAIDEGLVVPVESVLGSVTDAGFLHQTFADRRIETVFHAAAYKHVEMVENNAVVGIRNNTFGTLYAAQAARAAGATRFIFVSTDKAVRTTSIMGASKRMGEMILQALQQEGGPTRFAIVRFGNVLGSSGSVVPLFLEQIDQGGPVTVTHPEVTRYFMTIPEAAGLVLQAASMSKGGDLFLLDMGEPVRILDLARRIIRFKGFTVRDENLPDGDIEIRFTGLRPGEKLHEELLIDPGSAARTEHRKILRGAEAFLPWSELEPALAALERACEAFDFEAIRSFIARLIEGADINEQLGRLHTKDGVPGLRVIGDGPSAKAG